jgi:hypothetical protein
MGSQPLESLPAKAVFQREIDTAHGCPCPAFRFAAFSPLAPTGGYWHSLHRGERTGIMQ